LLELVEISSYFEVRIDSYVVGHRKPRPAIFELASERLKLSPQQAVYIGDSYNHDVIGAQNVGLRAVLLDPMDIHGDVECARIRTLSELVGDNGQL
jgi:putative hydrolase of the HAD superfamily